MLKKIIATIAYVALCFSSTSFAAETKTENLPQTLLIKTDQNGDIYVHRSSDKLGRVSAGNAQELENLEFVKVSDLKGTLDLKNISDTEELDQDRPRQSWYIHWNYQYSYGYGYYPYYPVYYSNYSYYPYYAYNYGGCNYYWYGGGGFRRY